jgi:glycosyltransferase involved in cell wall biosynthesis
MRLLFALPGFHRVDRGAETALLSLAEELARTGDQVDVLGSGHERAGPAYRFRHVPAPSRERFERFPKLPGLRTEMAYEEAGFAFNLARQLRPNLYDVTLTCAYPYTNWTLRARGGDAAHVFVTQNGVWPAVSDDAEYRFFGCDGLVCTNPDYHAQTRERWNAALIPNGVALDRFAPGPPMREALGLPYDRPVVLMVSAFMASKRVPDGIRAVAGTRDAFLIVAGDGPERDATDALAADLLPGRYKRMTLPAERMPDLYRSTDAFLHMSRRESFGNVFIEAAASGLPVVGHDSALTRWILGDEQFLCDTEDIPATTEALDRALATGRREPPASLSRFSWPTVASQYRSFFEQVVDGRRTAA